MNIKRKIQKVIKQVYHPIDVVVERPKKVDCVPGRYSVLIQSTYIDIDEVINKCKNIGYIVDYLENRKDKIYLNGYYKPHVTIKWSGYNLF